MKYIIWISFIALISFTACSEKNTVENTKNTVSDEIKVETFEIAEVSSDYQLNYSGIVEPSLVIPLSFEQPGTIIKINVEEGDFVKSGQILAVLDQRTLQNSYNAALASQKQAQDAYDRLKQVYENGSLPQIQWEEMKANLEKANSIAAIAKENLEKCFIVAPSEGVIGSRSVEVGENILPGIAAFELISINDVFVKISVPENEINRIREGHLANIEIPAINTNGISGVVEKVGVMANPVSKTYEVKIRVKNSEMMIKPGMVCDTQLDITNSQSIITVPFQSVIREEDNKNYIYVVNNETNTAKKQEVEIGVFSNNFLEIKSGIKSGDIIVVSGQHKLMDNSKIYTENNS